MPKSARSVLSIVSCLSCLLLGACSGLAVNAQNAAPPVKIETLTPQTLRGYGTVAGAFRREAAGSVLEITCDNADKGRLTQAKYLSDLQILPGVKEIPGQDFTSYEVPGQGSIAAFCSRKKVTILAATNAQNLASLVRQLKLTGTTAAQVSVPMWLDRWDKYGFRFYYWTWQLPEGKNPETYDITREFTWAEKENHSGLVIAAEPCKVNNAEGLVNNPEWDWALKAAKEKNLPVGLNTNAGYEAPVWLLNRFRDQVVQKMPGYVGSFYDTGKFGNSDPGWLSWSSTTGKDALLAVLQQNVRLAVARYPNVTSYLEPHAELEHGCPDIFLEYGPVADASYRKYLQTKYSNLETLNQAWKTACDSWKAVRVEEIAAFAGLNAESHELGGEWSIKHEPTSDAKVHEIGELASIRSRNVKSAGAPAAWFGADFDDQSWARLTVPGHDAQALLPRWPAVFRKGFKVAAAWKAKHPVVWLYVWDLNRNSDEPDKMIKVVLNGKTVGESPANDHVPHRDLYNVSDILREGPNTLAIRTPQGRINYKVYLSTEEPRRFPNLSPGRNQQWVDYMDWVIASRVDGVRRGMEMIREVDPDRGIVMMSPYSYISALQAVAKAYGGDFHDTGGMGGNWDDIGPAMARGVGLPFSTEPGGPATNVTEFQVGFGNWITEGVNAVDYFIHIGSVMWNPEIRQYFEANLPVLTFMGKYHPAQAEVAALQSQRVIKLMIYPWRMNGYPWAMGKWGQDPTESSDSYLGWMFNPRAGLRPSYESDALGEEAFAGGDADRYKVIIDSNTVILDDQTITAIEQYVRNGGVFVTYGETGRYTTQGESSWPISRLTGYRVLKRFGHPVNQPMQLAAEQTVFPDGTLFANPEKSRANGLCLEKAVPEAQNVLLWEDGTVAMGLRPLGKGYVIHLGAISGDQEIFPKLFAQLLRWRQVAPIPAHVEPSNGAPKFYFRHFITNNGLCDVWTIYSETALTGNIVLDETLKPAWMMRVQDGSKTAITNHRLPITIAARHTEYFLTPRADITQAPAEWFNLQRAWWKGTTKLRVKLPPVEHRFSVDLTDAWAFKPLDPADSAQDYLGTEVDDAKWEKVNMGIWNYPDHPEVRHAVLRRQFTVPKNWTRGRAEFWLRSWNGGTFLSAGQVFIDGKPATNRLSENGAEGVNPDNSLQPGTTHTVAVEIIGKGMLNGSIGPAWLWFWPDPVQSIDLAGTWQLSTDGLSYPASVRLPGKVPGQLLRQSIEIPAAQKNRRVMIDLETGWGIHMVIINGHMVARHHHYIGSRWQLDITPLVTFGKNNEIIIVARSDEKNASVSRINLNFYEPGTYP